MHYGGWSVVGNYTEQNIFFYRAPNRTIKKMQSIAHGFAVVMFLEKKKKTKKKTKKKQKKKTKGKR